MCNINAVGGKRKPLDAKRCKKGQPECPDYEEGE
jgi:hypothetical protein